MEQATKPNVTLADVRRLLRDLFGIDGADVEELNAYIDRSYLIKDR
jgi:hypothetical protein